MVRKDDNEVVGGLLILAGVVGVKMGEGSAATSASTVSTATAEPNPV